MIYLKMLCRLLGALLLTLTLPVSVMDITTSITQQSLTLSPFGLLWRKWFPALLQRVEFGIQENIHPDLWFKIFVPILSSPAILVMGVVGFILLAYGLKKPKIKRIKIRRRAPR